MSASVPIDKPHTNPVEGSVPLPGLTGERPSWAISLVGHLLVLSALWPLHLATSMLPETIVSGSVEAEDEDEADSSLRPESLRVDSSAVDQIGNKGDSSSDASERVAMVGPAIETPKSPVLNVEGTVSGLGTRPMAVKRPMLDVGAATAEHDLTDPIASTGSTEHTGGVRGAIDRLTIEIEASLRQENTLLVWLFDATPSMKSRRDEIADRFENVYRQLGLLGVGANGALKTVVATFGKSTEYLTSKPVDDVGAVQKAIRKIKDDAGDGKGAVENVFAAALNAGERFRKFRTGKQERRRVMIVIVTDERGTDCTRVEEAIQRLRKLGIRVYCVGDDAVFGRAQHFFPHIFPDGYRGQAFTNRGPESCRLESLQLAFWGHGGEYLGEITSGFGPYSLCRLCAETGGLYLISEELRGPKFDPAILRSYLPDYRPMREYEAECAKNAAKSGLTQAAMVGMVQGKEGEISVQEIPRPQFQFRADNDNRLRQEITEAQKPLAELDYRLNEMYAHLEVGEKDRQKLDTLRWRAGYDLAMGRVLAMRARAWGYNLMLAEMKTLPRPFQDPSNNTWRIVPSSEEHSPPRIQKFAKRAREYLERVIQEHHGTQWELLAQEELRTPMGWDWHELHVEYPPPAPPRAPGNPIQLERERQQRMMTPRMPPISHTPPKL